jgi:hypothetical protein
VKSFFSGSIFLEISFSDYGSDFGVTFCIQASDEYLIYTLLTFFTIVFMVWNGKFLCRAANPFFKGGLSSLKNGYFPGKNIFRLTKQLFCGIFTSHPDH